jgi:hypothetical protein
MTAKTPRVTDETAGTAKMFRQFRRVAPRIIEDTGILDAWWDDDRAALLAEVGLDEDEYYAGPSDAIALARRAPSEPHFNALEATVGDAINLAKRHGYMLGLAVGLELANGGKGGVR